MKIILNEETFQMKKQLNGWVQILQINRIMIINLAGFKNLAGQKIMSIKIRLNIKEIPAFADNSMKRACSKLYHFYMND